MNRLNIPSPRLHQGEQGEMPACRHPPSTDADAPAPIPFALPISTLMTADGRRYRIPLKFARRPAGGTEGRGMCAGIPFRFRTVPSVSAGRRLHFRDGREVGRTRSSLSKRGSSVQCHGCIQREEARRRERDVEATGRGFLRSRSL